MPPPPHYAPVADNQGAKTFYEDFGFRVESEESAAYAAVGPPVHVDSP